MKVTKEIKATEFSLNKDFDTLGQGFESGSFYGLEYILEDFFQDTQAKPAAPVRPSVDWFGLDN